MTENYSDHYIFSLKGVGSSYELRDCVRVTVVFVQNSIYKWDPSSLYQFSVKFENAMAVLQKTAKSHRVFLNFEFEYLSSKIEHASVQNLSWLVDFLSALGYSSLSQYQAEVKRKYMCDEAPVVFVWNCGSSEFAVCADEHSPNKDEFSVLCSQSSPNTILHEFLHQFGAIDLYFPPDTIASARRNFGDTVMIHGSYIDPLTCYLIGWKRDFSKEVIAFLEDTKHYTMGDCICSKIERFKNTNNTSGILTDKNGKPIVAFSSFDDLVSKANQGNATACFLLGYCYCFGIIVKKDLNKALELYRKNIINQESLAIANYSYAKALLKKESLSTLDKQEIKNAFLRAIASNHTWAINDWGMELLRGKNTDKDTDTGYKYLLAACCPAASNVVLYEYKTVCYYSKYIPELYKVIVENSNLYEQSCLNGSSLSQLAVGKALLEGKHLPKDEKKAVDFLSEAAKSNDYIALFELGYCYEHGIGIEKDLYKSRQYYESGEKVTASTGQKMFDREFFKRVIKRA